MRVITILPCLTAELNTVTKLFTLKEAGINEYHATSFPDKKPIIVFIHVESEEFDRIGDHKAELKVMIGGKQVGYAQSPFQLKDVKKGAKFVMGVEITYPSEGRYTLNLFLDNVYAVQMSLDAYLRK